MAGALRKVSLNYNWTIKRAHNDLNHNIIEPQPQPTSPPFPDTKPGDFSVLPWDSNRLGLKFKNDYEEVREHLERAFLILFGWAVALDHLRTVATRHFINHPTRSVVALYEKSGNLAHLGISPTSIWGSLLALSRLVAAFISSWFWEIFGAPLLTHALRAGTGKMTDTSFVSQLVEHPVVPEKPEGAPRMSDDSDVQAPIKGHTDYDTSDAADVAPPLPVMSVTDDMKGGDETIPTVTHDDTGRFSLRKARSHNDIESDNARKARPGLITRGSFSSMTVSPLQRARPGL